MLSPSSYFLLLISLLISFNLLPLTSSYRVSLTPFHPSLPPPPKLSGRLLLPPPSTMSHFLHKAALYVYNAAATTPDGQPSIRAVIVDQPTAFTMNEMGSPLGRIGDRPLFTGGESGHDTAILLHAHEELSPPSAEVCRGGGGSKFGAGGRLFEGGLDLAAAAVDAGLYAGDADMQVETNEDGFKFFFNYVEITHAELEDINKSRQNKVAGIFMDDESDAKLASLQSLSSR